MRRIKCRGELWRVLHRSSYASVWKRPLYILFWYLRYFLHRLQTLAPETRFIHIQINKDRTAGLDWGVHSLALCIMFPQWLLICLQKSTSKTWQQWQLVFKYTWPEYSRLPPLQVAPSSTFVILDCHAVESNSLFSFVTFCWALSRPTTNHTFRNGLLSSPSAERGSTEVNCSGI